MSLETKYPNEVKQILSKYPPEHKRSAVMPLLYLAQREEGYLSKAAMQDVAQIVGITETDIAALVGFYTLYQGGEVVSHILLRHRDIADIADLKVYQKNGGFEAFKNAVTKMTAAQVIDVVKNSGLRGRGGAGFPTRMKGSFLDKKKLPHYVVAKTD